MSIVSSPQTSSSLAALIAAALAASYGPAGAAPLAPAPEPDAARPPAVEEVVVSASRAPRKAAEIGASVTVLDQGAITASQIPVISDLLATTPGVQQSRNGGIGGVTSLRLRGAETDQTVVVIDGVKINDPAAPGGGYNFANLMIGDAARIEILRGSQSTLWGGQAIGGVVNIITAEPKSPLDLSASVEGGSFGTAYARAAIGGRAERIDWRLAAGYFTTDGVSAYAPGAEADGYRDGQVTGRVRVAITQDLSVDLRGLYSDARADFDGFPPPAYAFADDREYGTTREGLAYLGVNLSSFGGRLKNRAGFGYTDTRRVNYNPDQAVTTKTFESDGDNRRFDYQGALAIADGISAIFGVESERAAMRSSSPSSFAPNPPASRAHADLDGVFGQLQVAPVTGLTLTGGLRHDHHGNYGDHDLGEASLAYTPDKGETVLRASFGQGFKPPTLYQLFSDYGNAALKPEVANTWDVGVERFLADRRASVRATYFHRRTTNQIDFASCTSTSTDPGCTRAGVRRFGYYANIARTHADGVEAEATMTPVERLTLSANYTWTRAINDAPGANYGHLLARRPEHAANVAATYAWPLGLSTGIRTSYVGNAYDALANTYALKAHLLVDLLVSAPVTREVEVYGRIENLTDKRYETTRGYGVLGRGVYAGVRASY